MGERAGAIGGTHITWEKLEETLATYKAKPSDPSIRPGQRGSRRTRTRAFRTSRCAAKADTTAVPGMNRGSSQGLAQEVIMQEVERRNLKSRATPRNEFGRIRRFWKSWMRPCRPETKEPMHLAKPLSEYRQRRDTTAPSGQGSLKQGPIVMVKAAERLRGKRTRRK
ncbi:hypothetical protein M413DRAFT_14721 [Hebeloma cylindrosporum]|uniref:Uncharacterized protein n=1 Tax=Hebeloma cylindrosporum TaxID=76867 RepID=A0A0C2XAY8_HEBCY|nr:hypothetical protein M413DRAFT_14721 [Hebeloma cylindrosporum h7]